MNWYVDSGATTHMTMNESVLVNKKAVLDKEVIVANNSKLKANCAGDMSVILDNGKVKSKATFKDVTYVPNLCANLLSVSCMATKGNKIVFKNDTCEIFNTNRDLIGTATLVNGLYRLNYEQNQSEKSDDIVLIASESHEMWVTFATKIC